MLSVLETLCVFLIGVIVTVFVAGGTDLWQMLKWRNFARALAVVTVGTLSALDMQSHMYASLEAEFKGPAETIAKKDAEIAELKQELNAERDAFDHLEGRMSMMQFNRQVVWRGWMPFQLIRGPEAVVYQDVILESEDTCSVVRPCLVTDYDSDLCPFDLTMLVWQ